MKIIVTCSPTCRPCGILLYSPNRLQLHSAVFDGKLFLSIRQTIIRQNFVSTVLGLFSPCTLLDYIIHSFEMPYSAFSFNLAAVSHLCGGWTTAHWPQYSDEPLGEVSGWHQPAGMCNEERIKQGSGALGHLAVDTRGVDSGLLMCRPRMNESTTLPRHSPPPGTDTESHCTSFQILHLQFDLSIRWGPPLQDGAGQWFPTSFCPTVLSDHLKDWHRHLFQLLQSF